MNQSVQSNSQPWIHTYQGRKVMLLDPQAADIDAIDIAHSLSYLNRFTGHAVCSWSVAQHSVVGSILSEILYPTFKWLASEFLLHDSPEAYVGDVSSPLKSALPGYRDIESKHRTAIEKRFAVSLGGAMEKLVDLRMLATERKLFMPAGEDWGIPEKEFSLKEMAGSTIGRTIKDPEELWDFLWDPWAPEDAEQFFLERMEKLKL